MKKTITFLLLLLILTFAFSSGALASLQNESLAQSTEDELFSLFDSKTLEALEEIGIDGLEGGKIYDVSFANIAKYFSTDLSQKLGEAVKSFMLLVGIIMIAAAVRTFVPQNENGSPFVLVSLMTIALLTVGKLSPLINMVLSVLDLSAKFMLGFIPVFAGIIAFSGNPATALTYNTVTLGFAEGISAFSNNTAVSVIGGFFCLSISFGINSKMNLSRFTSAFSKLSSVTLGFIASLFTGLISIKGIMSAGIDTVSAKGIRFMLGSMIPVVGGAISEAYGAIVGSIGLIKGSVAVVGIIASLIINIPAVFETVIYCIIIGVVSFFAEALGMNSESQILKAFGAGIRFLLLLLIYEMFIMIISVGIMLTVKASV